jgi:hypothetical protein
MSWTRTNNNSTNWTAPTSTGGTWQQSAIQTAVFTPLNQDVITFVSDISWSSIDMKWDTQSNTSDVVEWDFIGITENWKDISGSAIDPTWR